MLSIIGELAGLVMQVLLVCIGIEFGLTLHDESNVLLILVWCIIATIYLGFTVIGLNVVVWIDAPDPRPARAILAHPIVRLLSTILSFGASLLGAREAFVLIVHLGQHKSDPLVEVSAIWTMLVSWTMFNWGYARIYYSHYHRSAEPPLLFPNTPEPRISDFVYFAFTNATTFSVSDVQVTTSRMRWTVVWHTCFAFFFNALIIGLSMNVILKGEFFAALLD